MDLLKRYNEINTIYGYKFNDFIDILNDRSNIKIVNTFLKGCMILSTKEVIPCVNDFYDSQIKDKKYSVQKCAKIQKEFNILFNDRYECVNCHKQCIDKLINNEITKRKR